MPGEDPNESHVRLYKSVLSVPAIIASRSTANIRKGLVPRDLGRGWIAILDCTITKGGAIVGTAFVHDFTE
jgi:hypothetical protein